MSQVILEYTCAYAYIPTYMYKYMYKYTHIDTHTCIKYIHVVCLHIYAHICISAHQHVGTYTYMYMDTCVYILGLDQTWQCSGVLGTKLRLVAYNISFMPSILSPCLIPITFFPGSLTNGTDIFALLIKKKSVNTEFQLYTLILENTLKHQEKYFYNFFYQSTSYTFK